TLKPRITDQVFGPYLRHVAADPRRLHIHRVTARQIRASRRRLLRGLRLQFGRNWGGLWGLGFIASFLLTGCSFAPKYHRPAVETPAAYKELASTNSFSTNLWKMAEPSDAMSRGKCWEMFNDPQLNVWEEQVAISNQNVAAAFANYLAARALVKEARAQLFPTVSFNPSVTRARAQSTGNQSVTPRNAPTLTQYSLPLDATWQLDLWGRIRNTVKANSLEAQATAGDLENTRLAAQAELATDYFELRAQDSLQDLFDSTVAAYQKSLE